MANPPVRVICVGEALFDCFPDRQVLGGAPVNVAVHLNALLKPLGGSATPATRIGDDPLGHRFLGELTSRGVDTSLVQIDDRHPTGTVQVRPQPDGQTEYDFATDVAWDHLELTDAWRDDASKCDAVCLGTLAHRSAISAATVSSMLMAAGRAIRLLDVNLRQDFFSAELLDASLRAATAAKVNEEELTVVARLLGVAPAAEVIQAEYGLDWLAVTHGKAGTMLHAAGNVYAAGVPKFNPAPQADTVGAGDACSAGLLLGVLSGWDFERTVTLANHLGAYVASQPGATPALPDDVLALVG